MNIPFLSDANTQHVSLLCMKYLETKHQLRLSSKRLTALVATRMKELYQFYEEHPPHPSLDELNKRVIGVVKEDVLLWAREQAGKAVPSGAPPPAPVSTRSSKTHANIPLEEPAPSPSAPPSAPPTGPPSGPPREEDPSATDTFLRRLQELEWQRTATLASSEPLAPVVQAPAPLAPPSSAGPTVLYVPTVQGSRALTRTIAIHGLDRPWHYLHDRAVFPWNGEEGIADAIVRITCVMLPIGIRRQTPIIEIHIQGAGQQSHSIWCHPTTSFGNDGWDVWKPPSEAASRMPSFACPWIFTLRDVLGRPLGLGSDGFVLEQSTPLSEGRVRWKLSPNPECVRGQTLMCRSTHSQENVSFHILSAVDDTVCVEDRHGACVEGAICALQEMQATVLLELEKK